MTVLRGGGDDVGNPSSGPAVAPSPLPDRVAPYRMNPEACRALVKEHGTNEAAANWLGIAKSTIWYWLHPELGREARRERDRRHYDRMSWQQRYKKQLFSRRWNALQRIEQRSERS